jgi:DegV family protein with EDD domain
MESTLAPPAGAPRNAPRLGGHLLRRALAAGIRRVIAQRDEINRINVFPVPDGDTGTNLAFTLSAVLAALAPTRQGHAGELLRRAASEAIDGARGNSGAILAQFFQGLSESLAGSRRLTAAALASAAQAGARLAREALAEPREGTILSVIHAFAAEWKAQVDAGQHDFRAGFAAALAAARRALAATPDQLPVLRTAGVVDAGALGFVDLLEGIDDFIRSGHESDDASAISALSDAGVEAPPVHGCEETHRWCTECMVSADGVDRLALKGALLALPLTSLVLAGTRDKVRVHAHIDEPQQLFEVCGQYGRVSSQKADDMLAQVEASHQSRSRVAVVTDSGADLPPELMERWSIHLVPVRVSFGSRDFLDKVSLSSREFFAELRTNPVHPRTSQPPPGDFRRMFEFLLSHHQRVVYVGLSRALSGTLQSAETAAARVDATRASVFDSAMGSAAQGLLAIDAAEAAARGMDADAILARLARMRERTSFFAVVRDLSYGVRGGRAPKLALPLSRFLRLMPVIGNRPNGRLGVVGALFGRDRLPERFAASLVRRFAADARYRVVICHCDCEADGRALQDALRARVPQIAESWLIEAGSGIGAHAGPGSLVVGLQALLPGDAGTA